jgi:alkanesulfonate monooxygenase SsuD/methylene tetrahydromethanopterin reductase-like flavin-dependent oxidoreductase (luciferase family)
VEGILDIAPCEQEGGLLTGDMQQNPADKGNTKRDLSYWTNLAKLLERGGFLSLFIADTYGGYDTYEGSLDNCVGRGTQWPVLDPVIVSSLP